MSREVLRTVAVVVAAFTPCLAQTTFSNTAAISCAVGQGGNPGSTCLAYPSNITVSGMTGTVSSIQVRLNNISIDRQQDLIAVLVGSNGSNLVFISDTGSSSNTNSTGITLTFADSAANSLDQVLFATGTFKPTGFNTGLATAKDNFPAPAPTQANLVYPTPFGTATLASQFNGINPNGTWSLYVIDDSLGPPAGSGGVTGINIAGGWSLIVTTAVAAVPTATTVTSSLNPSFTGNAVTFTARVTSSGNPVTTGTVTFFEGAVALSGAVALNASGQATFNTSALTEGVHVIRADYSGATGFASSSGTVSQEVNNTTTVTGSTFCNTGGLTVANDLNSPAATPYPSKVFVTGLGGTISSMSLDVRGLTGGRADDFEMLLVGPNGNKFVFLNDVGGANAVSGVNLTLSDGAGSALPDETVFGSGTFRPTAVNSTAANFPAPAPASPYNFAAPFGAATFASNYGGAGPNGTWQLFFVDDSGGGTQSRIANGWCVSFVTTADTPTTTTVTSSLNPSFTTAPNNSVTFTATVRRSDTNALVTSGSVTFLEGSTVLSGPTALNASGQASFTTTSLTEGTHVITAAYGGSPGSFNLSTGSFNQTVDNHTVVSGLQFCNPGPLTIPTSGVAVQYPARIFVSGLSGVLSKVTMSLNNMNGVRPDDLDLLLVGPTGAKIVAMSDAGGPTDAVATTITLDDAAASQIPDNGPLVTGTFRPTSITPGGQGADAFPSPAPAGPHGEAAPSGTATFASTYQGTDPNGTWQVFVNDDSLGGPGAFTGGVCLNFTLAPDLAISKTHTGNFTQGQTGAQYTIVVNNASAVAAAGTVTVDDTLPAGLTATAITGSGWSCSLSPLRCSRSDGLAANGTFPAITLTVDVASNAAASVTNRATVSFTGDLNAANNSSDDFTVITPLVALTIDTVPAGRSFSFDGNTFTSPQTFNVAAGSNHTIATTTPQAGAAGTQYVFANWSDAGAIAHTITAPGAAATITANFSTQHFLTTLVAPAGGGTILPASGFFNAGPVNVSATANAGFAFSNFTGALTGSTNPQTLNLTGPATVTANFAASDVQITIDTVPAGRTVIFDGNTFTAPQTFNVAPGSNHTVATTTPQAGAAGTRYVFANWSDAGAIAHTITAPGAAATITANFTTQHFLTTLVAPSGGGTISPASGFFDAGPVTVSATANAGFNFSNFTGALTGTANPQTLNLTGPATVTANFVASQVQITVDSVPAGRNVTFDGNTFTAPQTFSVAPGSNHTVATTTPQSGTPGTQFVFANWSDAGAISHSITAPASGSATFTASFTTQYLLTTQVAPSGGGNITPPSGFFNAGSAVSVSATANAGFTFANFSGALSGSINPQTLNLTGPATVTANFASSGAAALTSIVTGKSGPANARVWSFRISNAGPGSAANAQVGSVSLTQQAGTACTPVISSALPASAGTIAPLGTGTATVAIDFSSCAATARFQVTWTFSANAGASTGTMTLFNQFQ